MYQHATPSQDAILWKKVRAGMFNWTNIGPTDIQTHLSTFLTSCSLPHARAKCRVKCTGQGLGKRSRGKCIGRASAMGKGTRQGNRPEHGARAWDKGTGHRERGKGTGQVHGGRARGMCIGQGHGISAHAKCNFTRQGLR